MNDRWSMFAIALVSACLACGCGRLAFDPDDEVGNSEAAATDEAVETPAFTPLLCVTPGPCPWNEVQIASAGGWVAGHLRFRAMPYATDLMVTDLQIEPGADGVYLEDPGLLVYESGQATAHVTMLGVSLNVAPGQPSQLLGDGTATLGPFSVGQLTLRFAALDRFR